jgi:hypothetical protein
MEEPTVIQRIIRTLKQCEQSSCLRQWSTHENWLLAMKYRDMYQKERLTAGSFTQAQENCMCWVTGEILSGRSKATYTKEEYIAAGGTDEDYDFVEDAWKGWLEFEAQMRAVREGKVKISHVEAERNAERKKKRKK